MKPIRRTRGTADTPLEGRPQDGSGRLHPLYGWLLRIFGPADTPTNPLSGTQQERAEASRREQGEANRRHDRANTRRRRWHRWTRGRNPVPGYTRSNESAEDTPPQADEDRQQQEGE